MKTLTFWFIVSVVSLSISACSASTKLAGVWKDSEYHGRIDKVYIVGVSNQEIHRRLFEDEFARHLLTYGVTSFPSHRDLPDAHKADRTVIDRYLRANHAETLLITRVIGKETKEVVHPGYTTYREWPFYGPRSYAPAPYYRHYWSYYDRRYDLLYAPATVSRYQVITAECNLYDAQSGRLIWSAQLETIVEKGIPKLMEEFIETVTRNLSEQGLL